MTDDLQDDLDLPPDDEWQPVEDSAPAPVPCSLITGIAGTGKSYTVMQRAAADPLWAKLTASTGIAAVNLSCTTLNSVIGYFDDQDLRDKYLSGHLARRLRSLRDEGYQNLLVEECSMLSAEALDMLYRGASEAGGIGLVLVGDWCQLPPIKAKWAFEADCWPRFEERTERLTKVWRQADQGFLDALNLARRGAGAEAARLLSELGAEWHTILDTEFDGTTIVPKNDMVDRYNGIALSRVAGASSWIASRRWGKQRGEWKQVPERMELKVGAYVMLLSNQREGEGPEFAYVNGDCGHVRDIDGRMVTVELLRTGAEVSVTPLVRSVEQKDKPDGWGDDMTKMPHQYLARHHRGPKGKYVLGQIEYLPMRLAYASTVHKSQGLSLDRAQVDFRNAFFGSPAMLYVSLSRCRTLQGLRLVGQPDTFAARCNTDPKVAQWL